jgi:hypothetical protein
MTVTARRRPAEQVGRFRVRFRQQGKRQCPHAAIVKITEYHCVWHRAKSAAIGLISPWFHCASQFLFAREHPLTEKSAAAISMFSVLI